MSQLFSLTNWTVLGHAWRCPNKICVIPPLLLTPGFCRQTLSDFLFLFPHLLILSSSQSRAGSQDFTFYYNLCLIYSSEQIWNRALTLKLTLSYIYSLKLIMTLLLFGRICILGCLALSQEKDIRRDTYLGDRRRHLHNVAGQDEVIDITYNIVAQKQSGTTTVQDVPSPMTTSGITHQVS